MKNQTPSPGRRRHFHSCKKTQDEATHRDRSCESKPGLLQAQPEQRWSAQPSPRLRGQATLNSGFATKLTMPPQGVPCAPESADPRRGLEKTPAGNPRNRKITMSARKHPSRRYKMKSPGFIYLGFCCQDVRMLTTEFS